MVEYGDNKKIIGAKVRLIDETTYISYEDLVKLLKENGYVTKYIEEAMSYGKNLHSLYFTPYEVQYVATSNKAEAAYENAGYSCVNYYEMTLSELLQKLELKETIESIDTIEDSVILNDTEEVTCNKKIKSKYIRIKRGDDIFFYRKKKIKSVHFLKDKEQIIISLKAVDVNIENATEEDYKSIESQLTN